MYYSNTGLLGAFPDSFFCLFLYWGTGDSSASRTYLSSAFYFRKGRTEIFNARPPPEVFGETDDFQENFQEEKMEYRNDELKNHFSAYVKQAVKNTKGHYLNKKWNIEHNETDYEEDLQVPGQGMEDLLCEMDALSGRIFHGVVESRMLLDQIGDYRIYQAITSLAEEQKNILVLRIFYEKSFREIGCILGMAEKKAENTYYNAVKKIRRILGGKKDGV